jgi:hypothetical protein
VLVRGSRNPTVKEKRAREGWGWLDVCANGTGALDSFFGVASCGIFLPVALGIGSMINSIVNAKLRLQL